MQNHMFEFKNMFAPHEAGKDAADEATRQGVEGSPLMGDEMLPGAAEESKGNMEEEIIDAGERAVKEDADFNRNLH